MSPFATLTLTFTVTVSVFGLLWLRSLQTANCGIADVYWAPGFIVIAWLTYGLGPQAGLTRLVLPILVTLWGVRLGWLMIRRYLSSAIEEPRYARMRREGGTAWPRRSLFSVFILQGVIQWLIAIPLHIALLSPSGEALGITGKIGVLAFAIGIVIESRADADLARFKRDPANHGRLLTTGLFSWSRHPNYFGEVLVWWGLGLIAYAMSASGIVFVGPALLTALILTVSGIPLLERELKSRAGFDEWARRTSAFLPLPPRH